MTATTKGREFDTSDVIPSGAEATTLQQAGTITVQAAPDLQIIYRDSSDLVIDLRAKPSVSPARRFGDGAKRLFDITVALVALIATAPVWFVVALISGLGQGGPVLFSQERIGRSGRMFNCWKFRTMRVDADAYLDELLASDPELARQWALDRKLDDDPRITSLGRVLRRFDLDEIPQFLNILTGDMSVVGPRPVVLDEAPKFGTYLPTVLTVRPGLTGAWQVSGRNSKTYDERVQQEARYVETRSFFGDLAICIRTPLALLRRNGGR